MNIVMYYFVYDLDETLAEVYSLFYFLMCLKLKKLVPKEILDDNITIFNMLERAYYDFVNKVSEVEKSDRPLGILRPGILEVMKELEELRENKKVKKVIIYSNNGHLENLEFIKDVIIRSIAPSNNEILSMNFNNFISNNILIKDLIHWGHPGRNSEIPLYFNGIDKKIKKMGVAKKTWAVLQKIITKDGTENPDFTPDNVFFFDDIYPEHSIKAELGPNYYRVPRYAFKASSERLGEIFKTVMRPIVTHSSFNMDIYMNLVQRVVGQLLKNSGVSDLDNLVNTIKVRTGPTAALNSLVPEPDEGIDMMMDAITKVNVITKSGGRRLTKKKHRTIKKKLRHTRVKSRVRKI
jgi:hypothetical protein